VTEEIHDGLIASRSVGTDHVDQLRMTIQILLESLTPAANTTRLVLVEAFNGGPAALGRIRIQEARLGAGIRVALGRRERAPLPSEICRWIAAGCLRVARAAVMADCEQPRQPLDELTEWAAGYLDGSLHGLADHGQDLGKKACFGERSTLGTELGRGDDTFEARDLILTATLRLAASEGYWRLSMPRICKAAGVSRAKFQRHFHSVDECYLTAIQVLSRRYARRMAARREPSSWGAAVCRDITELCSAVAANAELANLVFVEVLAPGAVGMRRREEMIGEFAAAWRSEAPQGLRPSQAIAEATMAALWAAIAHRLSSGEAERLPREASRLAHLMLAPRRDLPEAIGHRGATVPAWSSCRSRKDRRAAVVRPAAGA
jgi:AcrR family transcriptional regulator